jgi:hypothetical protein
MVSKLRPGPGGFRKEISGTALFAIRAQESICAQESVPARAHHRQFRRPPRKCHLVKTRYVLALKSFRGWSSQTRTFFVFDVLSCDRSEFIERRLRAICPACRSYLVENLMDRASQNDVPYGAAALTAAGPAHPMTASSTARSLVRDVANRLGLWRFAD